MKKKLQNTPRLSALQTLGNILDKGQNLTDADTAGILTDSRDRALSRHLVYGVTRWLNSLQWLSAQLLQRPLKARDRDISRLIMIGLHQLWQDSTAPHAAIHETAESARLLGKPWAVGLVNAVLRRFQREQEQLLVLLQERPERFAHPDWLLKQLRSDWPGDWQDIAQANNLAAPLWLRINRSKPEQGEVVAVLEKGGFSVASHSAAADAIRVTPAATVSDLPGFSEGRLSVQDPAAQLAVDLMDLQPQQRVLDACAAPGGKTCHMLERMPSIEVTALDLSQRRLALVQENIDRLGFNQQAGLTLLVANAAETSDWWDGKTFDRILLDAPCTASGVIRRHPEIKWLRTTSQVQEVMRVQENLLKQLWPVLKEGGILVYATCSVLIDENKNQISRFLAKHDNAEAMTMDVPWGREQEPGRQILPGELEMDGFFYAKLRKTP